MSELVDHGAPQISAAQAEFEEAARHWQQQAAQAAQQAARYAYLARMLGLAYQDAIARSMEQGD